MNEPIKGSLSVRPIPTEIFELGEDLVKFILRNLGAQKLKEKDILAVTSKIVSLSESRVVERATVDKTELVKNEADVYMGEIGYGCHLTIKHGLLIPSSGIDESNASGNFFILYPKNPFESAKRLWEALRAHFKLNELGILITDSHTTPLRKGVTGISLAHWGIKGVVSLIGQNDLFGRPLKMTQVNVADALSVAAVFSMGEAAEKIPLALVRSESVTFEADTSPDACSMNFKEDLYYPLLKDWVRESESSL